jgi:hypothetical protein
VGASLAVDHESCMTTIGHGRLDRGSSRVPGRVLKSTPARASVNASALQAARLVFEAVNPLRRFAWIQRLLDVAVTVVRLRAFERFRQPFDKALKKSWCVAHLLLRRRTERSGGT